MIMLFSDAVFKFKKDLLKTNKQTKERETETQTRNIKGGMWMDEKIELTDPRIEPKTSRIEPKTRKLNPKIKAKRNERKPKRTYLETLFREQMTSRCRLYYL